MSNLCSLYGEEKIDGCHWGINMIFFFFFSLPDSRRPSFSLYPLLLPHHYTAPPSLELIEMGMEGHGIKF